MNNKQCNQRDFCLNEICISSIQAGIAHHNIYEEKENDKKRKEWRKKVINILKLEKDRKYLADNIARIEEFIEKTSDSILKEGKLTFGIAQKILNLFLKYCWSLGWTENWIEKESLDCPVDKNVLYEIKWKGPVWSKMKKEDYVKVMKEIDKIKGEDSRAVWEFNMFEKKRWK